jgi:hypothetical protein
MKSEGLQEAEALLEGLEPLLEPLARLARALEEELVAEETVSAMHAVRQPLMERLSDMWSQPDRLNPTREPDEVPHVRTRSPSARREDDRPSREVWGFRVLALTERRARATLDTAPNRVLSQGLQEAARRLERLRGAPEVPPEVKARLRATRDRLRAIWASGFGGGEEGVRPMSPSDLLHRSLRGRRYQAARRLWGLLRVTRSLWGGRAP